MAIGTTPARVLFGDAVHLDRQLLHWLSDHGDGIPEQIAVEAYIHRLTEGQKQIIAASDAFQQSVIDERLRDQEADEVPFEEGDYVLASYLSRPPNKLAPKWRGPFLVLELQSSTCICHDLSTLRHVRFHVSRLKKFNVETTLDPTAIAAVDNDEFVVEDIADHRWSRPGRKRRDLEFKVRWLGYEPDEDLWLPLREVRELEALDRYAANHPELHL